MIHRGILITAALLLAACGSDTPAGFESGTVIGKDHVDESFIMVPVSCGTNCTTYAQQYVPGSYTIHVGWCHDGKCQVSDFAVESVAFEDLQVGDTYPRTSREETGHQ